MNNIEIRVLNPEAVMTAERMMVCAARMTQRGHRIHTMGDFMALYNKDFSADTVANMAVLPHPTIQKFSVINVAVVGASRRFLAQITRHQNEVKFMSASLQYSDYSGAADFVVPYAVTEKGLTDNYIKACQYMMANYESSITESGLDNDAAGYAAPQGLRNILIISATPYQWKHMIGQRICRRNTEETRYVLLKIWEALFDLSPALFAAKTTGAFCQRRACREGKMSCERGMLTPPSAGNPATWLLEANFPLLYKESDADEN